MLQLTKCISRQRKLTKRIIFHVNVFYLKCATHCSVANTLVKTNFFIGQDLIHLLDLFYKDKRLVLFISLFTWQSRMYYIKITYAHVLNKGKKSQKEERVMLLFVVMISLPPLLDMTIASIHGPQSKKPCNQWTKLPLPLSSFFDLLLGVHSRFSLSLFLMWSDSTSSLKKLLIIIFSI